MIALTKFLFLSATALPIAGMTWRTENASLVIKIIFDIVIVFCLVLSCHDMAAVAAVVDPVGSALGLVRAQEDLARHACGSPVTTATVFNPYISSKTLFSIRIILLPPCQVDQVTGSPRFLSPLYIGLVHIVKN